MDRMMGLNTGDNTSLTDDQEFYTIAIYTLFILSLLIAIENILVVVSIVLFTPKRYSISAFILSASIADILNLFGPVSLSLYIYFNKQSQGFIQNEILCKTQSWLILFLRMTSTLSMLMLVVDRNLSLVTQTFYRKKWKGLFLVAVVLVCWAFSAFMASWPLFGVGKAQPSSFCPHIYCLFAPRSIYAIVFASLQIMFILVSGVCVFCATNSSRHSLFRASYSSSTGKMAVEKTRSLIQEQFNRKMSRMVALVVGVYCVCLIPWMISIFLEFFSISYPQIYGLLSIQIPMVSGLCNPFLYGLIWPPFRRAYEQALTVPLRMCRKGSQTSRSRDMEVSKASKMNRSYTFWTIDNYNVKNADQQVSTIDRLFGTSLHSSHEPIDLMPHELRMFENDGLTTDTISIDVSSPNLHESLKDRENHESERNLHELPKDRRIHVAPTNVALDNSAQFQSILDLIEEMTEGKTKASFSSSQLSLQKYKPKTADSNHSSLERSAVKRDAQAQTELTLGNGCDVHMKDGVNNAWNSSINSDVTSCVCLRKSKSYRLYNKEKRYLNYLVNEDIRQDLASTSDAVVFIDI